MPLEFLNKAPPWLIVLMFISMGGVGGGGLTAFLKPNAELMTTLKHIDDTLKDLDNAIEMLERKDQHLSWRVDNHQDRLNGVAVKNKEQDAIIQSQQMDLVRLGIQDGRPR